MTISARIPSTLDAKYFIPDLYSKNVIQAVKSKLVVVPIVNHSYEAEMVLGDSIYIPKTNVVTATEVTIGTEGVIKNPFNTAGVQLTIANYWEAPVVVDYMSRRQSGVDLIGNAVGESAYAIAQEIDSTLCDLFLELSASTAGTGDGGYGTDGAAVTDAVLIDAVEELDSADVPEENRSWVFDPSVKADLLTIDKFVRMDYFAGDTIPTGGFRKDVYGAPVLITNNLTQVSGNTGNVAAYLHRDALAIAIQESPNVDRVEQPLKHQLTINTTALWGVVELQDTFGCPILTRLA